MADKSKTSEPDFFAINQNELDREWVQQPNLCRKYSERLARAQSELEQAETALEVVDAGLDYKIRKRAGTEKTTEAQIKSKIIRSPEHQRAVESVQKKRYAVGILKAAVQTIAHRKTALENLVDLRLADYFSEPRTRGVGQRAMDDMAARRARKSLPEGQE